MKFALCSTCDDSGAELAKRLEQPDFVRVIESRPTREEAEAAKKEWIDWYASRQIPIGDGCLIVREAPR